MAATIMPERIRLLEESPERVAELFDEARKITKKSVAMAPANAKTGTEQDEMPANAKRLILNKIAIEAPKAAPADTPRVYGSAKGFNNIPWNTAPDMDNPAPTMAAVKILGRRTSKTITEKILFIPSSKSLFPVHLEAMILKTSTNFILI